MRACGYRGLGTSLAGPDALDAYEKRGLVDVVAAISEALQRH